MSEDLRQPQPPRNKKLLPVYEICKEVHREMHTPVNTELPGEVMELMSRIGVWSANLAYSEATAYEILLEEKEKATKDIFMEFPSMSATERKSVVEGRIREEIKIHTWISNLFKRTSTLSDSLRSILSALKEEAKNQGY